MTTFKVGDTVRLKSGGPVMTITGDRGSGVVCNWFIDGVQKEGTFPEAALESVEMN